MKRPFDELSRARITRLARELAAAERAIEEGRTIPERRAAIRAMGRIMDKLAKAKGEFAENDNAED